MSEALDLQTLARANDTAGFNRWAGMRVIRAEAGEAEIGVAWKPELGQYSGFLHAGVIAALLDTVAGFAASTVVGPVIASHFAVSCLSPAVGDAFSAIGRVTKKGKRQIFTRSELFVVGEGAPKLVATAEVLMLPA